MLRFLGSRRNGTGVRNSRASSPNPNLKKQFAHSTPRTKKHLAVQAMAALLLTLAVGALAYNVPFTGMSTFNARACNGNQICDAVTECTPAGGCTTSYSNCQSCGVSTKICGEGLVIAQNICRDSGSPSCFDVAPVCNSPVSPDPYKILTFNVFTKKNLAMNVTPQSQAGIAGSTLNYKAAVQNKNPKSLVFLISSAAPPGWTVSIAEQVTLGENSQKDIVFRVTSNETAGDGSYPVTIGLFNTELGLFGNAQANYVVGTRAPPSVSTAPRTNRGYPGQTIYYNATVTNNDPDGFDASTFSLRAAAPAGFSTVFTPASLKIGAQQTGSSMLAVTSGANATGVQSITINATVNRLSGLDFIEYNVDLCGNGVCDLGEEGACMTDCPLEPYIICDGRCETQLDDGLSFSATVTVPFGKFIVCSRESTTAACSSAAQTQSGCGIGKACLCSGPES